jgi:phage terminase large subunit GpA-like protein
LEGTRFKKETFPYAGPIMDASFFPGVEEIVLCAADQVAKSFIIETCIGYAIDRAPGPVLSVYPRESTSKEHIKDRYLPMIRQSSRLREYLTGFKDDEAESRINLAHMQIYASWATSPTELADRSIKYLVLDEVDKYPPTAGKREGTPIDKAEKRVRQYRYGRKIWKSSTPTIEEGPIWQEINTAQVAFEYRVTCPDCGTLQLMGFEQIKWPEDMRDPERVLNENLAHYVCPHCGSCWTDLKRDAAVRFGRWVVMEKSLDGKREYEDAGLELFDYLKKHKPRKIGFHIPSWISHVVKLSEVARAFLKGLKDKTALRDFNNSHRAYPWTDWGEVRPTDPILALRDERPRGLVPGGGVVSCLTAGVDTQGADESGGFWYEIGAWGWPNEDLDLEFWQIRAGYLNSWAALKQVLFSDVYKDREGNEYRVRLVLQDAMGHRTDEVYKFAKKTPGVIPTQGVDTRRMSAPYSWSNIDRYPGSNKPIPGGLKLLRFDATHQKDILASKLEINPDDPGAWHLNSETTEEWAQHLCAEFVNDKGLWEVIGSRPNHGLDCSVLNILATEILGVKFWKKENVVEAEKEAKPRKKSDMGGRW